MRYTTLRVALFVLALIVLWLVRIRDGVLLVAIALVLSGLASFVLLAGSVTRCRRNYMTQRSVAG